MHVLGTPPAFVLSQDQTLKKLYLKRFHASNHFLNNRFWQLTQEFSLAVFAYASNKSINLSKVFCSSLRYSIYKVQPLSALAVSSLILARRLPFVKNFFQVFSNFSLFRVFFRPPAGSFRILSHHSLFVKYYFHFFDGFFTKFAEAEFIESRCCWQAAASVFGRRNYSIRSSAPRSHRPLLCRISCS